jgi:histidinol-phosphate aminotransferase
MMPRPRPEILGIAPYVGGESTLQGANRTIKLSSNEGAFGPPPGAIAALRDAATELHRYPDGSATALRRAIGACFKLDPERIVCGAGSDDLLYQLTLAYCARGDEIIMSAHGFSIYEIAAQYAGAITRKAPERNLTADVDAMLAQLSPRTRIAFIANPNNPTGTMLPSAELRRLRAGLPEDVLLVIDAAYAEYVDAPDYETGELMVDESANTVMTRTFSKIFGLGGARLGWCYAPSDVVDVLHRIRGPFNISVPAQAAGIAALAEPGWVEQGRRHNTEFRAWLAARLTESGITVHPSVGNFLLADFATPEVAAEADAHLRSRGIIVRRVGGYGLPHCLRITIGLAEECHAVAEALAEFMADRRG